MSQTALILSDVHLRDSHSVKTKLVLRFFQEQASRFDRIYILGDLFDVWPGTTEYLIQTFEPVLTTLKKLVQAGHPIHYIEGNHDFRLGRYFIEELKIQVSDRELVETWNSKRVYMAHGDLGNPKDFSYRALRVLLRNDAVHLVANALPGKWIYRLGQKTSQASRDYKPQSVDIENKVREIYRQSAETLFKQGYDYVMMGHTHIPDDFTVNINGRSCRYINSGDWVKNFTYIEYNGQDFSMKRHPVKELIS